MSKTFVKILDLHRVKLVEVHHYNYLVYSKNNYVNFSMATVKIVDSPNMMEFGFAVRSFQAVDEEGISFFNKYYSGEGETFDGTHRDITILFEDGASSFIVMKGVWAIYRERDYKGIISIDGKNEFEPGSRISSIQPGNNVKSVKLLRED